MKLHHSFVNTLYFRVFTSCIHSFDVSKLNIKIDGGVFLEKLIRLQLDHLRLFRAELIQLTPSYFLKKYFNIILNLQLVFQSNLFPLDLPTKTLYTFLVSRSCVPHTPPISHSYHVIIYEKYQPRMSMPL